MANYQDLKSAVTEVIKTNGNQEITGQVMQNVLLSIINSIGNNYQYAGIATPETNPGTPDQNVFYIASDSGTYSNFSSITIQNEVAILYNKNGTWKKTTTNIGTKDILMYSIEQGTIMLENGEPRNADNRVRTTNFLQPQNVKISTTNDILMNVYRYNLNGSYIPDKATYRIKEVVINEIDKCYKISFQKRVDGKENINVDDVLPNVKYDYVIPTDIKDEFQSLRNAGYIFAGIATPTTMPISTNEKIFYITNGSGAYVNFGNKNITERIAILKKDGTQWNKISTDIASYNSVIDLCRGLYTEISDQLQIGYYSTTIGKELAAINVNSYYRCLKIDDAQNGDVFVVKGTSGSSGRLYAKVKNNIVIETSDEGSGGSGVYIVTKDESFDTIVFNMENPTERFLLRNTSKFDVLQSQIDELKENTRKTINVLCFGNSFTEDSMGYVPFILKNIYPELELNLNIAMRGGCKLVETAASFSGVPQVLDGETYNPVQYILYNSLNGEPWVSKGYKDVDDIINLSTKWDIVTFQQNGANAFTDFDTYFKPFLKVILDTLYTKFTNPIKLGFILTHGSYGGIDTETIKQHWEGTVTNVEKIYNLYPFDAIFPYGTAVQNLRTTSLNSLGDKGNLLADTVHLQDGIGCLTAAYANSLMIAKLAGLEYKSVIGEKTKPNLDWITEKGIPGKNLGESGTVVGIDDNNCYLAQVAAIQAVKFPFVLTDISELQ